MSASPRQWLSPTETKGSINHYFDMDADFQFLGCDMDSDLLPNLYDFDATFGPLEGCENEVESGSNVVNGVVPSVQTIGNSFESNSTSPQSASDFTTPSFDNAYLSQYDTPLDADEQSFLQLTSAIRQLVHAKADASPNCASNKEKRRDAAISLHLQLLQDFPVDEPCVVSDSSVSGHSFDPCSEFLSCADSPLSGTNSFSVESPIQATKSPSTPSSSACVSKRESQRATSRCANRGIELVLDLNMNETASRPKKQKPRTQSQRESYINARRNGACEKHRKQHKRCHCFDSVSTSMSSVKKIRAQDRPSPVQAVQERNNKVLQLVQAGHEALKQGASTAAESVDAHLSLAETYTCLFPGCTFTCTTVPSLERHYYRHSDGSSPTVSPTSDTQRVRSRVSHTPQYVDRPVWESSSSDANAVSATESPFVHTQGGLQPKHLDVHVIPRSSSTAGVPDSSQQLDYTSSYARTASDNKSGSPEQYDGRQEFWRDRQVKPQSSVPSSVPLESPSERNAVKDSSKRRGDSTINWLAQAYTEILYRGFIAISFSWFFSNLFGWLQNFGSLSMAISSSRQPHVYGPLF
ncbi:hypothetical protein DTO207G8_8855 [Paecilomyces variotii]|nr:hypothetical protein DTO169E5_8917 [Paecilomyces variotii]KAJ9246527.1 hypothetical protein DTO207G8_8855 [Paecilomyces variotii]